MRSLTAVQRRRVVLGVAVLLLLTLLALLLPAWWRTAPRGHRGSDLVARAAEQLATTANRVSGRVVDPQGAVMDVDAVLLGDGRARVYLQRPGGGVAELRSDGERTMLRANLQFLLDFEPAVTGLVGEWSELPSQHPLGRTLSLLLDDEARRTLFAEGGATWRDGRRQQVAGLPAVEVSNGSLGAAVEESPPHRLLSVAGEVPAAGGAPLDPALQDVLETEPPATPAVVELNLTPAPPELVAQVNSDLQAVAGLPARPITAPPPDALPTVQLRACGPTGCPARGTPEWDREHERLAQDPAHPNKPSYDEADVAMSMWEQGLWQNPQRSQNPSVDYEVLRPDGTLIKYDIKAPYSREQLRQRIGNAPNRRNPGPGILDTFVAYDGDREIRTILEEIAKGEVVVLDPRNLTPEDLANLVARIEAAGLTEQQVVYWDPEAAACAVDGSCNTEVSVTNHADAPAEGVVHVEAGGQEVAAVQIALAPGETRRIPVPADPLTQRVLPWFESRGLPEADAAQQRELAARGINPSTTGPHGTPMTPQMREIGRALTSDPALAPFEGLDELFQELLVQRSIGTLHRLITSGRVVNQEGLLPWLQALAPAQRRGLINTAGILAAAGRDLRFGADAMVDVTTGVTYAVSAPDPGGGGASRPQSTVPPAPDTGDPGQGTLVTPEGETVLVEGEAAAGPQAIGEEGRNALAQGEVAVQAAEAMAEQGATSGDLFVNEAVGAGQAELVAQQLPAGAQLRVYVVPEGSDGEVAATRTVDGTAPPAAPADTALFTGAGPGAGSGLGQALTGGGDPAGDGLVDGAQAAAALEPGAAAAAAPDDTGGIDFSSLELRYVAGGGAGEGMRYAFRADAGSGEVDPAAGAERAEEASDAFFVWLALPPQTFWVNLAPAEPDRIIDPRLRSTDVGRIMLEADLELKRQLSAVIHPDTPAGAEFWAAVGDDCVSLRAWIVPDVAVVREQGDELFILEAPLDVMMESEVFETADGGASCPQQTPEETARVEDLFRGIALPLLVERINTAPEFADLRRAYLARIAAEWFREREQVAPTVFTDIINSGDVGRWVSEEPFDPQVVFDAFLRSLNEGEFQVTEERVVGDFIETTVWGFGGVDFSQSPRRSVDDQELAAMDPELFQRVSASLEAPAGAGDGEVWLGAGEAPTLLALSPGPGGPSGPRSVPGAALPPYLLTVVLVIVLTGAFLGPVAASGRGSATPGAGTAPPGRSPDLPPSAGIRRPRS